MRTIAATSLAVATIAALGSCSKKDTEAVPELPTRICWDVFTAEDVTRLLPPGKKVTLSSDRFELPESLDSSTCSLDIDGTPRFQASAKYLNFESLIDWSSYEAANPEPVNIGKKGIIWYSGASTYVVCEPSKSPSTPGRYIELQLSTFNSQKDKKPRSVVLKLLKQFAAFAQNELKCQ
jgi:hypothetical protein